MTRDEVRSLFQAMALVYHLPEGAKENKSETLDLWAALLSEYQAPMIFAALKAYMLTDTPFAPTPGQLIGMISKAGSSGDEALTAWEAVRRAIRNGTYGAEAEFDRLPEDVQRAVGSPAQIRAWALDDSDGLETVIASQFIKSYRAQKERAERMAGIPANVRELLAQGAAMLERKGTKCIEKTVS